MTNPDRLPYVEAELNYLAPPAERPRYYAYEPGPSDPPPNMVHELHLLPIHDMRPISHEIGLDTYGFTLVEQRSAVRDFWDDDEVRAVYYPEAAEFIKQALGASRVFIFDNVQRRRLDGVDRPQPRPTTPTPPPAATPRKTNDLPSLSSPRPDPTRQKRPLPGRELARRRGRGAGGPPPARGGGGRGRGGGGGRTALSDAPSTMFR